MPQEQLERLPDDWQKALAIVAHPDDLEYGVSGAVASWTSAGKQVVYLLATRGEAGIDAWPPERTGPVREAEERESARVVGVDTVEFLGYRDGIVEYGLPLRRDLARAIRRHQPEVLVIGNFDLTWPNGPLNQADHRAVSLAAIDATRDAGNRWIFNELLDEGLEPWGGTRFVFVSSPLEPTHACELSEADLERGIASLQAHRAYLENLGSEFDVQQFLREAATRGGATIGARYGATFRVLGL